MRVLSVHFAVCALAVAATAVRADIDYQTTQSGGEVLSGSPDDFRHTNLEQLLMKFNNDLVVGKNWERMSIGLATDGDGSDPLIMGELQQLGRNGYIKCYDRLMARSVMRILLFNDSAFPGFPDEDGFHRPPYRPIDVGSPAIDIRDSRSARSAGVPPLGPPTFDPPGDDPPDPPDPPTTLLPEPTTVAILGIAAVVLMGRRSQRHHEPDATDD